MLKKLITLMLIVIVLTGCSQQEVDTEINIDIVKTQYEFNESFVKLKVKNEEYIENINIQTDEIFKIELEQEDSMNIPNENEQYKDNIVSNIEINEGELDINFDDYSWFKIPTDVPFDYYNVYQYIIYGIDRYYNGDVTEVFTSRLPDDIFDETTNVIFKVNVYGDNTKLNISIDMFNNNIRVEEVQK